MIIYFLKKNKNTMKVYELKFKNNKCKKKKKKVQRL